MGLTGKPEQIKCAVEIYRKHFPRVIGMKLYAGHSVGDLGVIGFERQFTVYTTLAQEGYEGFLSVHAEKEESLKSGIWNPNLPITHCLARPAQAEIDSVRDQILLAYLTKFKGKLHFAHLSVPGSVDLVRQAQLRGKDVSWEVCAHHLIFDWSVMQGDNGVWYKVNPPIRDPDAPNKMIDLLREDPNGILTDDHAPHTEEDKTTDKFMSGIVGLPYWPLFEEFLRRYNFSDKKIQEVMFENAVRRLGIDVTRRTGIKVKDSRKDYPFDFYAELERRLDFKW